MDVAATAQSLIVAQQGLGRLEAGIAMLGQQIKAEGSTALAVASQALPSPAPGKGLVVDTLA